MEDAGITNAQILLDIAQLANVNPKALVWCEGETLPEGAVVGQPKKLHELDDVTARCIQAIEFEGRGAQGRDSPIGWRRRNCSASTSACSPSPRDQLGREDARAAPRGELESAATGHAAR
jgi:hypothetical protein